MGINVTALDGVEYAFPALPAAAEGRTVYISRHGESMYNLEQRLGGDPDLSPRGRQYAKELGRVVNGMGLSDLEVDMSNIFLAFISVTLLYK